MGAGDGRRRAREVGSGGHLACEVLQGRMDDAGGHNGDIPRGDEGASGGTVEGTGSPHHPPDDRLGGRGMVEVEVRHGQGAQYQYDVLVPNVVVTAAVAAGMEVRIGLNRDVQAVRVYTMGC